MQATSQPLHSMWKGRMSFIADSGSAVKSIAKNRSDGHKIVRIVRFPVIHLSIETTFSCHHRLPAQLELTESRSGCLSGTVEYSTELAECCQCAKPSPVNSQIIVENRWRCTATIIVFGIRDDCRGQNPLQSEQTTLRYFDILSLWSTHTLNRDAVFPSFLIVFLFIHPFSIFALIT